MSLFFFVRIEILKIIILILKRDKFSKQIQILNHKFHLKPNINLNIFCFNPLALFFFNIKKVSTFETFLL